MAGPVKDTEVAIADPKSPVKQDDQKPEHAHTTDSGSQAQYQYSEALWPMECKDTSCFESTKILPMECKDSTCVESTDNENQNIEKCKNEPEVDSLKESFDNNDLNINNNNCSFLLSENLDKYEMDCQGRMSSLSSNSSLQAEILPAEKEAKLCEEITWLMEQLLSDVEKCCDKLGEEDSCCIVSDNEESGEVLCSSLGPSYERNVDISHQSMFIDFDKSFDYKGNTRKDSPAESFSEKTNAYLEQEIMVSTEPTVKLSSIINDVQKGMDNDLKYDTDNEIYYECKEVAEFPEGQLEIYFNTEKTDMDTTDADKCNIFENIETADNICKDDYMLDMQTNKSSTDSCSYTEDSVINVNKSDMLKSDTIHDLDVMLILNLDGVKDDIDDGGGAEMCTISNKMIEEVEIIFIEDDDSKIISDTESEYSISRDNESNCSSDRVKDNFDMTAEDFDMYVSLAKSLCSDESSSNSEYEEIFDTDSEEFDIDQIGAESSPIPLGLNIRDLLQKSEMDTIDVTSDNLKMNLLDFASNQRDIDLVRKTPSEVTSTEIYTDASLSKVSDTVHCNNNVHGTRKKVHLVSESETIDGSLKGVKHGEKMEYEENSNNEAESDSIGNHFRNVLYSGFRDNVSYLASSDSYGNTVPVGLTVDMYGNTVPIGFHSSSQGNTVSSGLTVNSYGNIVPVKLSVDLYGNAFPIGLRTEANENLLHSGMYFDSHGNALAECSLDPHFLIDKNEAASEKKEHSPIVKHAGNEHVCQTGVCDELYFAPFSSATNGTHYQDAVNTSGLYSYDICDRLNDLNISQTSQGIKYNTPWSTNFSLAVNSNTNVIATFGNDSANPSSIDRTLFPIIEENDSEININKISSKLDSKTKYDLKKTEDCEDIKHSSELYVLPEHDILNTDVSIKPYGTQRDHDIDETEDSSSVKGDYICSISEEERALISSYMPPPPVEDRSDSGDELCIAHEYNTEVMSACSVVQTGSAVKSVMEKRDLPTVFDENAWEEVPDWHPDVTESTVSFDKGGWQGNTTYPVHAEALEKTQTQRRVSQPKNHEHTSNRNRGHKKILSRAHKEPMASSHNTGGPKAQGKCFKCGQPGHISYNCKQNMEPSMLKCFRCKEEGHIKIHCPQVPGNSKCFHCQQEGHIMTECPRKATRICYICRRQGHTKANCPSKDQLVVTSTKMQKESSSFSRFRPELTKTETGSKDLVEAVTQGESWE